MNRGRRDDTGRKKAERYLKGWRHGAAYLPIPPELVDDGDFSAGWGDGREASRAATAKAEAKYGTKFSTIRAILI